jgi:hypothetical protein
MSTETIYFAEPAYAAAEDRRRYEWLWIVILAVAAAVPYLPTLGYGFVYDDLPQIVDNHDLSLRNVPGYFAKPIAKLVGFHDASQPVFYRPLFYSQLCLTRTIFGPGPFGFHLFSLLLHIGNTLLLYVIAVRLRVQQGAAYLAGMLFAVHPVHVESVVWPSASPELMVLAAMLCSLIAFLTSGRTSSSGLARNAWFALSLTAFLVGLFVKETALVTVPLIAAIALLEPHCETSVVRRLTTVLAPYLGVTLFYFFVRYRVLHGLVATVTPTSLWDMARTWPSVLWFYERHLVLPTHASLLYDYDLVPHATLAAFWVPLAAVLATLAVAAFFLWRHRSSAVVIAILMVVLPIFLVLNFRVFYWGDLVHDRYLYTPSAGFCILAAMALSDLGCRLAQMIRPSVQRFLAAGLLSALALTTVAQAQPWKNNLLLLLNAVEVAPGNIAGEILLGNELENRDQFVEAEICYTRAVQLTPAWGPAWFAYGRMLLLTQDPKGAIQSLQHAVDLDDRPIALVWLALAMDQGGRQQEAHSLLARAVAQDPSMVQAYAVVQQKLIAETSP